MKKDFSDKSIDECNEAALNRVYRSLSAKEQSSKKLRNKLELEGYPPSSIEYALNKAASVGVLDDVRYCDMLVRSTLSQGKGMNKCLAEIESLGIDPMNLESYSEYVQNEDANELDRALDYLSNHRTHAKDIRASAFRKLVSRGYSLDIASKASRIYCQFLSDS